MRFPAPNNASRQGVESQGNSYTEHAPGCVFLPPKNASRQAAPRFSGKTHLHLMFLSFLRLFPELALRHGFGKNESQMLFFWPGKTPLDLVFLS